MERSGTPQLPNDQVRCTDPRARAIYCASTIWAEMTRSTIGCTPHAMVRRRTMKKATILTLLLSPNLLAQLWTDGYLRPLEPTVFHDCAQVEQRAREVAASIGDRSFLIQLFPSNHRSLSFPFPTDQALAPRALEWLADYRPEDSPYALLYSLDGKYAFRCRDDQNRRSGLSGDNTNLLQLQAVGGSAVIWHFFMTPQYMAHAFVVAQMPLEQINGIELMNAVKNRLGARYLFLYVRNDPWFLRYSYDTLPYVFSDSYGTITAEKYRRSKTLVCFSDTGCRLKQSQE